MLTQRQMERLLADKYKCDFIRKLCEWSVVNKATTIQVANQFDIGKGTAYKYMTDHIYYIDKELHKLCYELLMHNKHTASGKKALDKEAVLCASRFFVSSNLSTGNSAKALGMATTTFYKYVNEYIWRYDKELAKRCREQILTNLDNRGKRK